MIQKEISLLGSESKPVFAEWAYAGADMFDYYCLFHEALKFSPDLIVVPINWRYFGSAWIGNSVFFHPELSALVPLKSRLASGHGDIIESRGISVVKQIGYKANILSLYFIGFKNWAVETRRSILGHDDGSDASDEKSARLFPRKTEGEETLFDLTQDLTPDQWLQLFPMEISDSNATLRELRAFVNIASQHDTKTLFFIWPLNEDNLREMGVMDEPALEKSKRMILDAVNPGGAENIYFSDLSDLLGDEDFQDFAGHCAPGGKKKIVEAITPQIMEMLELDSSADK